MTLPIRIALDRTTPAWVESGATYFVTGCCRKRGLNSLCTPDIGPKLLASVVHYHEHQHWFCRLFLLMPDHFHALLVPSLSTSIGRLVGNWKRYASSKFDVEWQHNFFEHRIRSNESWEEKAAYIRQNPVRTGLISTEEAWPYFVRCMPDGSAARPEVGPYLERRGSG